MYLPGGSATGGAVNSAVLFGADEDAFSVEFKFNDSVDAKMDSTSFEEAIVPFFYLSSSFSQPPVFH